MGVIPVGDIYKSLTFDGETSKSYNVYITGEAVFNAPERSVEMITIPGRNGAYALDNGRFENIQVTYPASIVADSEADFANAISDFRNFLCSRSGYCRLSDDYNPNEYRMAIYKSGLEVDTEIRRAGEFNITFECKPQRWLTSGETAVTVGNSDELVNPTYFESSPLLASLGYGNIAFNGYEVEIGNVEIGDVLVYDGKASGASVTLDESKLNVGDIITVKSRYIKFIISAQATDTTTAYHGTASISVTDTNSDFSTEFSSSDSLGKGRANYYFNSTYPTFSIVVGTNSSVTNTVSGSFQIRAYPQNGYVSFSATQTISYDASTHKITYSVSNISATVTSSFGSVTFSKGLMYYNEVYGYSTKSAVTDTVYIDCDIGECWTIQGGEIVNLNGVITLGSDLPTLAPGTNTFTFDNTITQLKVTPRWWKV